MLGRRGAAREGVQPARYLDQEIAVPWSHAAGGLISRSRVQWRDRRRNCAAQQSCLATDTLRLRHRHAGRFRRRPLPALAPRCVRCRRPGAARSRGTRSPSATESSVSARRRACRRSDHATPRSHHACPPRTYRSRRDRRDSARARARAIAAANAPRQIGGRHFAVVVGLEALALPDRVCSRSRLWLESEPLCTRHVSLRVETDSDPATVTANSVRHAGVADRMRAGAMRQVEVGDELVWAAGRP